MDSVYTTVITFLCDVQYLYANTTDRLVFRSPFALARCPKLSDFEEQLFSIPTNLWVSSLGRTWLSASSSLQPHRGDSRAQRPLRAPTRVSFRGPNSGHQSDVSVFLHIGSLRTAWRSPGLRILYIPAVFSSDLSSDGPRLTGQSERKGEKWIRGIQLATSITAPAIRMCTCYSRGCRGSHIHWLLTLFFIRVYGLPARTIVEVLKLQ